MSLWKFSDHSACNWEQLRLKVLVCWGVKAKFSLVYPFIPFCCYSGGHISWHELFLAGNQGNHQNFVPSLVFHKLWLIWKKLKQKNFFFSKKKFKMADSKKLSFSTTPKSWAIVAKILQIGPWVSRIDWCKGHQCDSTYMAVRLSDVSSKKG